LSDLNNFLDASSFTTRHSSLVIGAGGSARAVVYALASSGWKVTIAARRPEQAENLTESMQTASSQIESISLNAVAGWRGDLLVNTTPLGMAPAIETCPWPENTPLPDGAAVYDLVYNPRETRLVREARAAGLPAITGLGMLVEQAALAFETWTGCRPPRTVLRQAAEH
jgi:shikimate dehydrogenase